MAGWCSLDGAIYSGRSLVRSLYVVESFHRHDHSLCLTCWTRAGFSAAGLLLLVQRRVVMTDFSATQIEHFSPKMCEDVQQGGDDQAMSP